MAFLDSIDITKPDGSVELVSDLDNYQRELRDAVKTTFQVEHSLADGTHNAGVLVPTGAVVMFGGTAAPSGYLLCDGSAVSRSTYSALFAVIGTAYGVGDGSTTFNLPNMQQRFPLGKAASGTGATLGGTGGAIDHDHTPGLEDHNHNIQVHDTAQTGEVRVMGATATGTVGTVSSLGVNTTPHNTGTNNPPFQTFNFIIKT